MNTNFNMNTYPVPNKTKFIKHSMPRDGQCFFHAIAFGILYRINGQKPNEKQFTELSNKIRQYVVNQLQQKLDNNNMNKINQMAAEFYKASSLKQNVPIEVKKERAQTYINTMSRSCTWGGQIELSVMKGFLNQYKNKGIQGVRVLTKNYEPIHYFHIGYTNGILHTPIYLTLNIERGSGEGSHYNFIELKETNQEKQIRQQEYIARQVEQEQLKKIKKEEEEIQKNLPRNQIEVYTNILQIFKVLDLLFFTKQNLNLGEKVKFTTYEKHYRKYSRKAHPNKQHGVEINKNKIYRDWNFVNGLKQTLDNIKNLMQTNIRENLNNNLFKNIQSLDIPTLNEVKNFIQDAQILIITYGRNARKAALNHSAHNVNFHVKQILNEKLDAGNIYKIWDKINYLQNYLILKNQTLSSNRKNEIKKHINKLEQQQVSEIAKLKKAERNAKQKEFRERSAIRCRQCTKTNNGLRCKCDIKNSNLKSNRKLINPPIQLKCTKNNNNIKCTSKNITKEMNTYLTKNEKTFNEVNNKNLSNYFKHVNDYGILKDIYKVHQKKHKTIFG